MGLKDQGSPPTATSNPASRPPSRPATPSIITASPSTNRPGLKSHSTTQLPTMSAAAVASSSLAAPHDRSRSDNLDFNTLSRTPTPISTSREFPIESSSHHPDHSAEIASLSTKLINAVNHNTNLDDSLQSSQNELEATRREASRLRRQVETETQQKLHAERERRKVEGELETLTSSLFEEANSMVASARREQQEAEQRNEQMKGQLQEAETLLASHQEQLRELKEVLQQMQSERPPSEPSTNASAPTTPTVASSKRVSALSEQADNSNGKTGPDILQPDHPLSFSNLIFPILRHDLQGYEDFVLMLEAGQKTAPSSRVNSGQFAGLNVMGIGSLSNLKQSTIIKSQLNTNNSSLASSASGSQTTPGSFNTNSPTDMASSPTIASSLKDQKYYKRAILEDIEPTLRLDAAPGLSYFSRRNIVSSMASGNLVVEPFGPGQRFWSANFSCALCGEQRDGEPYIRRHRFRTSDSDDAQRYQICDYCLNRLRATADYVNFMRMIRSGYWKNDNPDDPKVAWEECTKLRERMFWARLGGGVIPSVTISDVTNSPRKPRNISSEASLPEIAEDASQSVGSVASQDSTRPSLEEAYADTRSSLEAPETPTTESRSLQRPSPTGSPSPAIRHQTGSSSGSPGPNKFLAARSRFESSSGPRSPERVSRLPNSPGQSPERRERKWGNAGSSSRPTSSGVDEASTTPLSESEGSPNITAKMPGSLG